MQFGRSSVPQADYRTKKVEDQPRIDVSGNTYTVYFKSGAWIRASVAGWGMNVCVSPFENKLFQTPP